MTTISRTPHRETEQPHWVEWVTGLVSAVLILAMIGWVGWEAVTETDAPPEFGVAITERMPIEGGYRVKFDISNKAARTAAAVVVKGEILDAGNVIDDADVTFDYVPALSKSTGAILFSQDPGSREVRIRAIGYTDP